MASSPSSMVADEGPSPINNHRERYSLRERTKGSNVNNVTPALYRVYSATIGATASSESLGHAGVTGLVKRGSLHQSPRKRGGVPSPWSVAHGDERKYPSPKFHTLGGVKSDCQLNWVSIDKLEEDLANLSRDFQEGRMLAFGENTQAILHQLDEIRENQQRLAISHAKLTKQMEKDLVEKVKPSARDIDSTANDDELGFFEQHSQEINGLLHNLHNLHDSISSMGRI